MKNFFLTGVSGLLGLNFFLNLKNNYRIYSLIHKKKISGIKNIKLKLQHSNKIKKFLLKKKINYFIHTAAITNIENCEKNKKKANDTNVKLTLKLSKICDQIGIKFIFVSSDHLFDGKKKFYNENDFTCPLNYYAKTKVEAEKKLLKHNPSCLIIRTNFFGFGPNYRKSFSDWIIDSLKNNHKIHVFKDVYFTPVSIDFLIKSLVKIIDKNISGIINISSDKKISKYDFALKLAKKFKLNHKLIIPSFFSEIKKKNNLVNRPKNMSLNNKKLKSTLNLKHIDIDNMINSLYLSRKSKTVLSIKKIK